MRKKEKARFCCIEVFDVEVSVWSNYSIGPFHCTLHDSLMAYVLFEVCVCVIVCVGECVRLILNGGEVSELSFLLTIFFF